MNDTPQTGLLPDKLPILPSAPAGSVVTTDGGVAINAKVCTLGPNAWQKMTLEQAKQLWPNGEFTPDSDGMVTISAAGGVTGFELRKKDGKPVTDWGKQVVLTTAAVGHQPADPKNQKYAGMVLPCDTIASAAEKLSVPGDAAGYAPLDTGFKKVHGDKGHDGLPGR